MLKKMFDQGRENPKVHRPLAILGSADRAVAWSYHEEGSCTSGRPGSTISEMKVHPAVQPANHHRGLADHMALILQRLLAITEARAALNSNSVALKDKLNKHTVINA